MSASSPHRFPWLAAFVLAIPAIALCSVGGALGLDGVPGIAVAAAGVAYLAVDLIFLQPRLETGALAPNQMELAAEDFLVRAMDSELVDDIATELRRAAERALGAKRAVLVVPDPVGGVRVVSSDPADLAHELGDPSEAFLWLGDSIEPLTAAELAGLGHLEGAVITQRLMATLGADVLLPLRHRGLLLGLALIGPASDVAEGDAPAFYRSLRSYATAAVANTFLDAEARGKREVSETLGLANAIQESLMPEERPVRRPAYELRGMFRPVAECGGDLWLWRELDDDRVLLLVADATGHGAAPALLSAVAKGAIDAHAQLAGPALDPAELLEVLNDAVHRVGRKRYLMTAFAAVVDTKAEVVSFSNASQNFPLLLGDGRIDPLVLRGNPLGADPGSRFETMSRPIRPGDKLLIYTDGLVEAGEPDIEPFGERRFRHLLADLAGVGAVQMPGAIYDSVMRFLGGSRVSDDITMVAFEYLGGDEP